MSEPHAPPRGRKGPPWAILAIALALAACGDDDTNGPRPDAGPADGGNEADAAPGDAGASDGGDQDAGGPPSACETLGLPERAFDAAASGERRRARAGDLSVELTDGTTWTLSEQWTGCETYVFVPDTIPVSALDATSVWESDLDLLLDWSPDDVHYFFVSAKRRSADALASIDAMGARVAEELGRRPPDEAEHWRTHLHVVADRVTAMGNWVDDVMYDGVGQGGFGIDRLQRIRGLGSLADVQLFSQALSNAGQWPWESNLAYAAYEARAYDVEAAREDRLDAEDATVVTFWEGELLSEFEEIDVALPAAEQMAGFDTLEIDVLSECPDRDLPEEGNCGAWDYIASLSVYDEEGATVELGRFITTYHRESRWIVDATPLLVLLDAGGTRRFRWEFAPAWNPQPTITTLSLRLSNQGKPTRPAAATLLWAGGAFDDTYDDLHPPIDVDIPTDAERVELWAVVTGHGAQAQNCAEFCDHQHVFTVGGAEHLLDHPTVGDEEGCVAGIDAGMTPNQWGTWWFGRGGWCPGLQVDPWVADVTADVTPGEPATIEYRGLLDGAPPGEPSGNIVKSSYLVAYR